MELKLALYSIMMSMYLSLEIELNSYKIKWLGFDSKGRESERKKDR